MTEIKAKVDILHQTYSEKGLKRNTEESDEDVKESRDIIKCKNCSTPSEIHEKSICVCVCVCICICVCVCVTHTHTHTHTHIYYM